MIKYILVCIIATTIVNAEPITNIQIQEWDDVYILWVIYID